MGGGEGEKNRYIKSMEAEKSGTSSMNENQIPAAHPTTRHDARYGSVFYQSTSIFFLCKTKTCWQGLLAKADCACSVYT